MAMRGPERSAAPADAGRDENGARPSSDGARVRGGVHHDGPGSAIVDGPGRFDQTATETTIPAVPPPPPAPEFPPATPSIPPLPAPPLVRRPGWGLDRPARRRDGAGRGPRVVQGRRARRVIRRIDTWTVLKLSFLFYLCILLVVLVAGIVLWNVAGAVGAISSVEKFIRSLFDLSSFKFHAGVILESSAGGGIVLVILATGINVLAAIIYNLISDVVGGVQVIVLEEQDEAGPGASSAGIRRTGQ